MNEIDFWKKIDVRREGCWEWRGCRYPRGYGVAVIGGKQQASHRWAWIFTHGRPIPKGMQINHRCDNTSCARPTHLYLGTQAENMRDRHERGGRWNNGTRRNGRRRTHCPQGHDYSENAVNHSDGTRHCRICMKVSLKKHLGKHRDRINARRRADYAAKRRTNG